MPEPTSDPDHIVQNRIEQLAGWIAGDRPVTHELRNDVSLVIKAIEAQGWVIDTTVRTAELSTWRERGVTEHHDRVSPLTMIGRPPRYPIADSPRARAAIEEVW